MIVKHDCSKCKLHRVPVAKIEDSDKGVYISIVNSMENAELAVKSRFNANINHDDLVKFYENAIDILCDQILLFSEWWSVMKKKYKLDENNLYYKVNSFEGYISYCANEKGEPVTSEVMIPKDGINPVYL